MFEKTAKIILPLTIVAATLAVANFADARGASAKTLVYCSESSPEGFDPALYTANSTWDASSETIYDRLTAFKPGTTDVAPSLAESWDVSPDGLKYTFHLRQGVDFHTTPEFTPSRKFNADDVVFSFHRQMKDNDPFHNYLPGTTWQMFDEMEMPSIISDVTKIDDYTVGFSLKVPDASFLAKLSLNFGSILSKEYADQRLGQNDLYSLNSKPVGTGPFKFVDYQPEQVIRFDANETYWNDRPKIDNLIFAITPDPATRMQRLLANECQIAAYPPPADIPSLKSNSDLRVLEGPGLNIGVLAFNTLTPPFDKREVRQALNMAINKEAIVDAVYQGTGQVAKSPIPATMWGYDGSIQDYKYDPGSARKLLAHAGVKDLSFKIWAMPVSRPYMPNARRVAEMMQADLADVGVTTEIVSYEWGEYLKRARDKNRDGAVITGATSDIADPDSLLTYFLSCDAVGGSNNSNWCSPLVDSEIKEARALLDRQERIKIYANIQKVVNEEAPWVIIASSTIALPMSTKVKNFILDPLGAHRFSGVDIAE